MTRKHFIHAAEYLALNLSDEDVKDPQHSITCSTVAELFGEFCPTFDKEKFFAAITKKAGRV